MLPSGSCGQLLAGADRVPLEFRKVLVAYGERVEHASFPISGLVSLLVVMQQGAGAEPASVGSDGMIGTSVVLGGETSPHEVIVQVSGEARRLPASALPQLLRRDETLWQGLRDARATPVDAYPVAAARPQARRPTLPSMADVH